MNAIHFNSLAPVSSSNYTNSSQASSKTFEDEVMISIETTKSYLNHLLPKEAQETFFKTSQLMTKLTAQVLSSSNSCDTFDT